VPDSGGYSLRVRLRALPVMGGLLPVRRSQVAADVVAGFTLAAVSIPVALGYAKIAGMPVVTGLYTLLLPMAVFAILGSSRHIVIAADSATAAIIGAALAGLAAAGSPQYVRLAGLVALLAGGLLLLARLARLGFLANFLSRHRPDRVPHRRRYPGGRRAAPLLLRWCHVGCHRLPVPIHQLTCGRDPPRAGRCRICRDDGCSPVRHGTWLNLRGDKHAEPPI